MENPKLIIEMLPDKTVNVTGPINDKILCYAMLECAKDAIRDFITRNQSQIIRPNLSDAEMKFPT